VVQQGIAGKNLSGKSLTYCAILLWEMGESSCSVLRGRVKIKSLIGCELKEIYVKIC
jgi:hypothetical protein